MRVSRIVKKGKSDVTVHFDDDTNLFLAVEVFLKSGLKKYDEISDDRFTFLIEENKKFHIRQKAFRLLGRRQHSAVELRNKLWGKDYDRKLIDEVLKNLKESGYIDDKEFIRAFAAEKSKVKNWSIRRIKGELLKRGLDLRSIDEVLEVQNTELEIANAMGAAKKKYESLKKRNLEPREMKNKLSTFLLSRGFDYETIKGVCDEILE